MKLIPKEVMPFFLRGLRIAVPPWDFLDGFSSGMVKVAVRMGADVLVFPDRPWMGENIRLPTSDTIRVALVSFSSYDDWWNSLKNYWKTRQYVRTALKAGVGFETVREILDRGTASEVVRIYNEQPFRERRFFAGYGRWSVGRVQEYFRTDESSVSSIAKWRGQVVGVIRAHFNGQVGVLGGGVISLEARRLCRGLGNLMIAKQIALLSERGVRHLVYGKFGVVPSLDLFKVHSGFRPVEVNYNHLLLTQKAVFLAKLGLHRRPDILMSKYSSILPILASLQSHLPVSLVMKLHLFV